MNDSDKQITAILAETGTAWLMDHHAPAMRHFFAAAMDVALAEVLDEIEDDMPLDHALFLAELWEAGKLIGGDAHGVAIALLKEIRR